MQRDRAFKTFGRKADGSARTSSAPVPVVKHGCKPFQHTDPDRSVRFDDAYARDVDAWARSATTGRPTDPSVWDGYAAMAVADACVQSAKTGRPQTVPTLERPEAYDRFG